MKILTTFSIPFADHAAFSFSFHFVHAKESWNRNAISLCQSKNFLTPRHLARSFPRRQCGSRDASHSGRLVLSQLCFPSEIMQPSSVGISPRFWFSSHATARIIREIGGLSVLSRFRQNVKLKVDRCAETVKVSAEACIRKMLQNSFNNQACWIKSYPPILRIKNKYVQFTFPIQKI